MRRGQLTIQFNWIFVLIIGVSILAMIIAFTFRHQDTAESRVSTQLAVQFETIFSTTAQQPGTGRQSSIPPTDFSFACNTQQDIHHYKINDVVARETPYDIIASSESFSTNVLQTWALQWNVPYPVDTMLYVTHPLEETIFYNPGSSQSVRKVLDLYPKNFSYRIINSSYTSVPTRASNSDQYTNIIFVDDIAQPSKDYLPDPEDFLLTPAEKTRVLLIDPDTSSIFESGSIAFLSKKDYDLHYNGEFKLTDLKQKTEHYIGAAGFFASIFSSSQSRYRCVMNQAYARMKMVTELLIYQTNLVEDSISKYCKSLIVGEDKEGFYGARYILKNINQTLDQGFTTNSVTALQSSLSSVQGLHNKIAVETACPLLY